VRRPQVEIMNRLGASERFIAVPFVIEAVGQALAAALIALGLLFALQQIAVHQIVRASFLPLTWMVAFVAAAGLLAWAAASLALARVLRSTGP
jgi:cell division protein FtsX